MTTRQHAHASIIAAIMHEALDIERPEALLAYLRATGRIGADDGASCRTLAGGVSNRTVLVELSDGRAWVLKQALAKLRVRVDWFSDPARIEREAQGLRYLERLAPPGTVTPLVFEDPSHHLLAMQVAPRPHENWKAMLLVGDVQGSHVEQFAALLGTIHRRASGSAAIAEAFADRSYFESLRLEPYYAYTAGRVSAAAAFLARLIEVTRQRRLTLVHGDYSPKNVLVHQGRLILLDHEVIHYGDPAFDLGFALAHLLSKAHHLPTYRDRFASAARQFMAGYLEAIGPQPWSDAVEASAVDHAMACLLARVAGRSTLEYLDAAERQRQERVIVRLLTHPPRGVDELVDQFLRGIEAAVSEE